MQPFRLAIPLGLFLALGSFAAQATPGYEPYPRPHHHALPPKPVRPAHPASRPPADFRPVHVQIHANRHHIGYGPALPPGWGRRLNTHQHRYVPHYQGYEWRRAGGDLVLVALTTGIVHEILHDVLR
jgi:Ni/Co efflux regulator RcnB